MPEYPVNGGGGGGAVASVFGRTGAVVALAGDYAADYDALGAAAAAQAAAQAASVPLATVTTLGDLIVASGPSAVARLAAGTAANVLTSNGPGSAPSWQAPSGGGVASVTAGDTSIVIGGTGSAPTVRTNTLDVIASDHPAAADWSNNSNKITSLKAATAASDAARLDQVGVTSVAAADTSIVVAGTVAAPTLATATLDVIASDHPPAANWSNNSKKITSLLNGSAAQDAAAFGQIPTALPPNGAAGGDLTGTFPNPTLGAAGPGATGPIGSTTVTPVVTIDAKGRVTALTSATIAAPGLTILGAVLGADVNLPTNTLTTCFSTSSLAIGTWDISANFCIQQNGSFSGPSAIKAILGTATATFVGAITCDTGASAGSQTFPMHFRAVVTVAGTISFQAQINFTTTSLLQHLDPLFTTLPATGWTAVKVA